MGSILRFSGSMSSAGMMLGNLEIGTLVQQCTVVAGKGPSVSYKELVEWHWKLEYYLPNDLGHQLPRANFRRPMQG